MNTLIENTRQHPEVVLVGLVIGMLIVILIVWYKSYSASENFVNPNDLTPQVKQLLVSRLQADPVGSINPSYITGGSERLHNHKKSAHRR
jgi:hypothetical protein